ASGRSGRGAGGAPGFTVVLPDEDWRTLAASSEGAYNRRAEGRLPAGSRAPALAPSKPPRAGRAPSQGTAPMDELFKQLPEVFSRAHPLAQLTILAVLTLGVAYFAYRNFTKGLTLKRIRGERDEARKQEQKLKSRARQLRTA